MGEISCRSPLPENYKPTHSTPYSLAIRAIRSWQRKQLRRTPLPRETRTQPRKAHQSWYCRRACLPPSDSPSPRAYCPPHASPITKEEQLLSFLLEDELHFSDKENEPLASIIVMPYLRTYTVSLHRLQEEKSRAFP